MSGISNSLSVSVTNTLASVTALQDSPSLQPFSNLDLTEQQRAQIRSIYQNAKHNGTSQTEVQNQIDSVLSPQQQQTLRNDITSTGRLHQDDSTSSSSSDVASSTTATVSGSAVTPTASPSTLDLIANVQNQATAAQATLENTLQAHVTQNGQGQS